MPGDPKVLKKFTDRYGSKIGKSRFYGHVMNDKKFAKGVGEMSVYNRGHKK